MLGSLGCIGKTLGKEVLTKVAVPFANDIFPGLASNLVSNATPHLTDKLGRKINGKEAVRAGIGFALLI